MKMARTRLNPFRALLVSASLLALPLTPARAQDATQTATQKFFSHVDFGVSAAGVLTKNSSGTNYLNQPVTLAPSTTVGVLVTLRYTHSPYIGGEFNYVYARYTDDFRYTALSPTGATSTQLGVQTNASEYTLGYVVHPRAQLFGLQPFVAVGAGSTAFRPTRNGGQTFLPQARATYYYTVGLEQSVFSPHLGVRVQFRQAFYNAPDYQTNYLRVQQRTFTTEPAIGFYLHF